MPRASALALSDIPGLAAPRRAALEAAGIRTARDLVFYLPKGHLDRATVTPVDQLTTGEHTIHAKVKTVRVPRFGRVRFAEAVLDDGTGTVRAMWFGRYDVKKRLFPGVDLLVSGRVGEGKGKHAGLQFSNPDFEEVGADAEGIATGGIIPIYPPLPGVGPNTLRRAIR
ncbi:MAG: hypothetical protein K8T20_16215, partial [Planctomycetes bacterium]|nr:hypothetical protein [Planctomycetota bacterium]